MNKIKDPGAKELIQQVEAIAAKTEELARLCPQVKNSGGPEQLRLLALKLRTLPEKELIDAYNLLKDIQGWKQLPDAVGDVVEKVRLAVEQIPTEQPKIVVAQTNCSLGTCSGPTQVQVDNLLIGVAAADLVTAIAKAAADTIAIFDIIGTATKIAQAIASGLDVVAKTLALAAAIQQRAADVRAECEDNEVQQLLIRMCNAMNDINNKLDTMGGDIAVIMEKLDELIVIVNEVKDVVDEILIHQIEEALAECMMLVGLYLPEVLSGSIEKVQDIVLDLIQKAKAAGITTANAESYWRQGAAALERGEYEKALQWFMLAYKQIQDKDMCKVPCPSDPCDKKASSCGCEEKK